MIREAINNLKYILIEAILRSLKIKLKMAKGGDLKISPNIGRNEVEFILKYNLQIILHNS